MIECGIVFTVTFAVAYVLTADLAQDDMLDWLLYLTVVTGYAVVVVNVLGEIIKKIP